MRKIYFSITKTDYYQTLVIIAISNRASRSDQSHNVWKTASADERAVFYPDVLGVCVQRHGSVLDITKPKEQNSEAKLNITSIKHSRPAASNCYMSKIKSTLGLCLFLEI